MKLDVMKPNIVVRNTKTGEIGVLYTGFPYPEGGIKASECDGFCIVYQGDDNNLNLTMSFDTVKFTDVEEYKLRPEDLLTPKHRKEVCKKGQDGACRYLINHEDYGHVCAKVLGNPDTTRQIDFKTFVNKDPHYKARGNNCGGRYNKRALNI
ncbi:MAG: hypothetical protein V1818_00460 [Candidatus Aenigmatarchaeota archaeon]